MSTELESDLELKIAHILLIDVVGYSKLLGNEQIELLQQLNQIVRSTGRFRAAESTGKLIRLPTGDGMALLFFDSPEAPAQCALEISKLVKDQPKIALRMGAHSGPVKEVMDVNDRSNIAGAGINIAQRVLDCGDAGHILLSKRLAEDLNSYSHWHPYLQDVGECEVKHGLKLHLFNLCKDGLGNPALPQKVECQQGRWLTWRSSITRWSKGSRIRKALLVSVCCLVIGATVTGGWFAWQRSRARITAAAPSGNAAILTIPEKSIAVLPFGNQSEEKANAYFADGVQDEILTDLSKVADLKVISRTSVMRYKAGTERNMRDIAQALGVAHVLEGSVQRMGNRVRVYAQLIDARTDTSIWANRYDRELADVFAIQSEVAQQIVAQLKTKLSPQEKAAIEVRPTTDVAAYDLYVRAKLLINAAVLSERKEDLNEAVRLLTQAVARDPTFFLAYYQLAHAHDQLYKRFDHIADRLALADSAIQTLQRLRPNSGEAHLALAKHLYWGYLDYDRARQELAIAQRALPNDPVPPLLSGYIDRRQGRWEDSTRNLKRALELDPQNSIILQQISISYLKLRQFPERAAMLDRALSVAPNDILIRVQRAAVELDWHGDTRPLHAAIESIITADPSAAVTVADPWLDLALCERDYATATRALDLFSAEGCHDDSIPFPRSWCEGVVARLRGDDEAAREAFTKARMEAEKLVLEQPNYSGAICVLAMADVALGRQAEAIREGRRAVELLPVSKDAIDGVLLIQYLAIIYAWSGEKDLALEQIALLAKIPSNVSYGYLRLRPEWDALRDDPRFENIVASLAPK